MNGPAGVYRHSLPPDEGPRCIPHIKKKRPKTYNTGYSLVVTDPTTNPALRSLTLGERTGPRIFCELWSLAKCTWAEKPPLPSAAAECCLGENLSFATRESPPSSTSHLPDKHVQWTSSAQVGHLIWKIDQLIASYREADSSIRRLCTQLELFKGTVTELGKWLQRAPRISHDFEDTLNTSLVSCRGTLVSIESHIKKVTPKASPGLGVKGRAWHVWDEPIVCRWEQMIVNQMQMVDMYIRMLHLKNPIEQDTILAKESTKAVIERGKDDRWSLRALIQNVTLGSRARRKLSTELCTACRSEDIVKIHDLVGRALQTGELTVVETLLQYGAEVNMSQDNLGSAIGDAAAATPLAAAIESGQVTLVNLLIRHGAKVVSESSETPLLQAVRGGDVDIVKALLEAGAIDEINNHDQGGRTPLFAALENDHVEIVRELARYGANVKHRRMSLSALSLAMDQGRLSAAIKLIRAGADVDFNNTATSGDPVGCFQDILPAGYIDSRGIYTPGESVFESYVMLLTYLLTTGLPVQGDQGKVRLLDVDSAKSRRSSSVLKFFGRTPSDMPFQERCNYLIKEVSNDLPEKRREMFLEGKAVMGVSRHDREVLRFLFGSEQ
ncbi:hypothetical protein FZEAL_2023 [Fusarium zealandicum]|uniref:Ankyrin repeat protein n=1 Tax=Fusarium zealandicum TaxID=1053134 RepID=A0A8H4XN57_9HYPO|nr:hypothetical protein FZEAL_2023 [Fusarium zealandicum]